MYFESKINGRKGLPWFDGRTKWEKSSDEYFEKLEELAQQLDDVDSELNFYTSLDTCDFDSGYEYVYGRIKELKEHIEMCDELDLRDTYGAMASLRDIYEELLDLYDSALLYDDYCGPDPDDEDDSDDGYDLDDDWYDGDDNDDY